MKHTTFAFLYFIIITFCLASCDKEETTVLDGSPVKITFTMQGDFAFHEMTRALEADGKAMTDVWVLDYVGTELLQAVHQTSTDEDFGTPTMTLTTGEHHLYFIASRGTDPTLSTTDKTIVWAKPSDTFWTDYAVTVTPTTNGNRSVELQRVVTKLKIIVTDALPDGMTTMELSPSTWYLGMNYQTGEPSNASAYTTTINIPSNYAGRTNTSFSFHGMSGATEWTTDVTVTAKNSSAETIGSVIITNVPLLRNRSTDYSGPLFGSNGGMNMTLSTDWTDSYEATW